MENKNIDWSQRFNDQIKWYSEFREFLYKKYLFNKFTDVLEIGCGTGALLIELGNKFNFKLTGIDNSEDRLNIARSNLKKASINANLHLMDISKNKFHIDSFDLIITNLVFLWIKDVRVAIENIYKILKKGGLLIIFAEPDYGGMIEYPDTGIKNALIKNLIENGADPFIGRKISSLMKNQFEILETFSTSIPWMASNNSKGLLMELEFFRNLLKDSNFDLTQMKDSILEGDYFLYNPFFGYVLRKL